MTESRRELPDPADLHRDIQQLCDRLHALVEVAATLGDEPPGATICLSPEQYERLLTLASSSPDLEGRADVTFDEDEPHWWQRREAFREKILDDLALREGLDYATFCQVLDNVMEEDGAEVPPHVAPAMLRAWLRSGDFEDFRRWRDDSSWSQVPKKDARAILDAAVDLLVQSRLAIGTREDGLPFWIKMVVPEAYRDGRERLEWLASHVSRPSNEGDVGDVGEVIREVVCDWYGDIEDDDLEGRLLGLRTIREIATSSSEPSGELYESLGKAWSRLMQSGPPTPRDEAVIAEAVKAAVAEAAESDVQADELRRWVVAVAPRMYPDLADRLLWFAETVGKAAGDSPELPEEVAYAATEAVCEWLGKLEGGSIEDMAVVLRTFRRTPMGACVAGAEFEACLARMAEAISA